MRACRKGGGKVFFGVERGDLVWSQGIVIARLVDGGFDSRILRARRRERPVGFAVRISPWPFLPAVAALAPIESEGKDGSQGHERCNGDAGNGTCW